MPSRNSCSSERAASSARRLLPTPGGPVSVTRRCSRRRPATWAQLVLAADERRRERREIAAAPAVDRDGRDRRVVREDRLLEAPQLEPRLEPQLVAEHAPRLLERLERVRLAAAAIERQHQLPPQALPEGVVRERRAKRRRELPMLSERQRNLELLLERVDAQRLESARLVAEPRRTRPAPAAPVRARGPAPTATASAAPRTSPSRNAPRVSASNSSKRTASTRASLRAYPSAEPTIELSPSAARRRAT